MHHWTQALQGGVLIGLASWILLAGVGRIAGVSAIASGVLTTRRQSSMWRWFFLFGLAGGGVLFTWLLDMPRVELRSPVMLVPAGLLVGFGTVLGSGCTSGHGVCGLGRRSRRSVVAVAVFMLTAITVVEVSTLLPEAQWWEAIIVDAMQLLHGR
jgi:uncharacterized protein